VESPSLEIFQPRLDVVLCSLLWVTLLGQGVGLGDPQRALPSPNMLGFCDWGVQYPSPVRGRDYGAAETLHFPKPCIAHLSATL